MAVAATRAGRVVVLRALGLGDLLTAIPALRALADAFPDHERVLAASSALRPLALLSGAVHDVVDTPPLRPLPPALSEPDVAVNLHGRGPESHRALLSSWPRRLIAFRHPSIEQTARAPRWSPAEHEVVRWCRLLEESGIPADPTRLDLKPPPDRDVDEPLVGCTLLHPGAKSNARRWPLERWAKVAAAQRKKGRVVVITGSASERELAERVAARAGLDDDHVLAGETDLSLLAVLVSRAGLVLAGDTGVAHLATAFGTPSVILFGPTPPSWWGPPRDREQHIALYNVDGAHGGPEDPHATAIDPGLLAIRPEHVLEAIERLPSSSASPPRQRPSSSAA